MADDKAKEEKPRPTVWDSKLTIEMDSTDPRNGVVFFGPERKPLRGCLRKDRMLPHEQASEDIVPLPSVVPGMRITIDGRTKEARIWDPLGTPEFASLCETLARTQNRVARVPDAWRAKVGPEKEIIRKLGDTQFKTWMYAIWQLVTAEKAVVIDGKLPSEEIIRGLPGKTQVELWSQGYKKKYLEDPVKEEPASV